jgi:hypothetical protein
MTCDAACPQRNLVLNSFRIKYKAKVRTKFFAYFHFVKFYSSFVLLPNNFVYFICYLAAQLVPTYVKCFIFVHSFEAP